MEQKNTGTKEIVETKDGKVEAALDKENILELSKTYEFEGEKISSLDFSGLDDLTAENMIRANNIMENDGASATVPENTMYYALIIAADATGMPVEFLKKLKPRDAVKVRRKVSRCFFGGD